MIASGMRVVHDVADDCSATPGRIQSRGSTDQSIAHHSHLLALH